MSLDNNFPRVQDIHALDTRPSADEFSRLDHQGQFMCVLRRAKQFGIFTDKGDNHLRNVASAIQPQSISFMYKVLLLVLERHKDALIEIYSGFETDTKMLSETIDLIYKHMIEQYKDDYERILIRNSFNAIEPYILWHILQANMELGVYGLVRKGDVIEINADTCSQILKCASQLGASISKSVAKMSKTNLTRIYPDGWIMAQVLEPTNKTHTKREHTQSSEQIRVEAEDFIRSVTHAFYQEFRG